MPIIFVSLSDTYIEKVKLKGFDGKVMRIENYIPSKERKTYYISPANSLCFMDGGIDYALSRIVFPNVEQQIKSLVKAIGIQSKVGKYYLPIGSSIIIDDDVNNRGLIVSPTMLLPQNVSQTNNAYYSTMSILYNLLVNKGENIGEVDIIFTSLCCGYGKMDEGESIRQIMMGIRDYMDYKPYVLNSNIVIKEANMREQPKYYQNTEFMDIEAREIVVS